MKVKFFITPVYPYGDDHYYHEIIALAEGFKNLGHTVFANADYWYLPEPGQYLLQGSLSTDYDIGIYDYRYAKSFEHLLFRPAFQNFPKAAKHVLVDRNDGLNPIWAQRYEYFEAYDVILSGNLFLSKNYPAKLKPWAIGLTERQMNQIDSSAVQEIVPRIGFNFRVGHNMRKLVFENLSKADTQYPLEDLRTHQQTDDQINAGTDIDEHYNRQSTGRHHPKYFETLNSSLLFLAFGGYLEYKPILYRPYSILDKIRRKRFYLQAKLSRLMGYSTDSNFFVYQQDNFRFWETLYSNTCPIALHVSHWDYRLPVIPVHGEHYLGIGDLSCGDFVNDLQRMSESEIKEIGTSGRDFANQNYSPKAQALRVLEYLDAV